jgi:hypothetical protein
MHARRREQATTSIFPLYQRSFLSLAAQLASRSPMLSPAPIRPGDPSCFFFSAPCPCAAGLACPPHALRVRPRPDTCLCTGCLATLGFHAYKSVTGNLRPPVAVHLLRISPLSSVQAPPLSNLEGAVNHRRAWPLDCFCHEQNLPEYINMIARSARSKTKLYLRSPRLIGSTVRSFQGTTSSFGWHMNSARLASFYLFPLT